jgi:hypothetical protein
VATYKLIQDIEAEDKILGPLTLRQFIFALITAFFLYICFICVAKGVPFLLVLFLPPALFFGFFAFPFGRDQPTELWALAKLNFWFKPRKRFWNQSGVKELVTITAPKKIEHVYTNGLSQNEVQSRLKVLANTIDSRGWAVKNIDTYQLPAPVDDNSDRLINIDNWPGQQEVPNYQLNAGDDILDVANNPIAQQFDDMINRSSQEHRSQLINQLNAVPATVTPLSTVPDQYWFMNQTQAAPVGPLTATPARTTPSAPITTSTMPTVPDAADDATLSSQLKARASSKQISYGNLRTLQPLGASAGPVPAGFSARSMIGDRTNTSTTVTATSDPAILSLSKNNDLNVATLAREARAAKHEDDRLQDEVVISLH